MTIDKIDWTKDSEYIRMYGKKKWPTLTELFFGKDTPAGYVPKYLSGKGKVNERIGADGNKARHSPLAPLSPFGDHTASDD